MDDFQEFVKEQQKIYRMLLDVITKENQAVNQAYNIISRQLESLDKYLPSDEDQKKNND